MLLGLSFFCLVVLFFLFPETSADTILLRRAQRLRKMTGNANLRSKSEIDQAQLAFSEVLSSALLRPFRLFLEPVVAFIDIYIALGEFSPLRLCRIFEKVKEADLDTHPPPHSLRDLLRVV